MRILALLILAVILAGCGGGGGGTAVVKPKMLAVGQEANYSITGTMSDGVNVLSVTGSATMGIVVADTQPIAGSTMYKITRNYIMSINGGDYQSVSDTWYVVQSDDGTVRLAGTYTVMYDDNPELPILIPSPLKANSWSWNDERFTIEGSCSNPETIGAYSAYPITLETTNSFNTKTEKWWMSPSKALPIKMTYRIDAGHCTHLTFTLY